MLAHHYLTALELLTATGADTSGIRERAVPALHDAAERAMSLNAYGTAAGFLSHAMQLLQSPDDASPELLLAAGRAFGMAGRRGDELERALAAFEARGDRERAAETAIELSRRDWHRGDTSAARAWIDRAEGLVEGARPSRARAAVLAEGARIAMVNYEPDAALRLSAAAIEVAGELGEVGIRADAMVTRGACLASGGDPDGLRMVEDAIALVGGRGRIAGRGWTNLAAAKSMAGEIRDAVRVSEEGLRLSTTEGDGQGATFLRGGLCAGRYSLGNWDDALVLADELLSAPDGFHYLDSLALDIMSRILEARGDVATARTDIERAVAIARETGEAQAIWPTITNAARHALRHDRREEADHLMREVENSLAETDGIGDPDEWQVVLVLTLTDLGRPEAAARLAERLPPVFWGKVCRAVLDGAPEAGADLLATRGEQPLQAELRVRAARRLVEEGRSVEAERQLSMARAFYRGVGAVAFLRAAEEVLAAAS